MLGIIIGLAVTVAAYAQDIADFYAWVPLEGWDAEHVDWLDA